MEYIIGILLELELNSIRDNKEHGIPVIEEVWESVLKM